MCYKILPLNFLTDFHHMSLFKNLRDGLRVTISIFFNNINNCQVNEELFELCINK